MGRAPVSKRLTSHFADGDFSDGPVLLERSGGIATVTLNRPEALNALSVPMWHRLEEIVRELAADDETAVVILTGAGRAFCAGNDIKAIRSGDPGSRRADLLQEVETANAIEHLPQPVIAAVNGYCFTAGLEILLVCDMVLAAESAKIRDTHAKWGLVPGIGGPQRLSRRVGLAQAKEMLFTSRFYSAAECAAIGLVNRVTPDEALMSEARTLAAEIAANSRESIVKQKRMMTAAWHYGLSAGIRMVEAEPPGVASDAAERLASFKRK